jgi:hypothetical protein
MLYSGFLSFLLSASKPYQKARGHNASRSGLQIPMGNACLRVHRLLVGLIEITEMNKRLQ